MPPSQLAAAIQRARADGWDPQRPGPPFEVAMALTEREWVYCADPWPLVQHCLEHPSKRKWCLIAAAAWRRWPPEILQEGGLRHLEATERAADDPGGPEAEELTREDTLVLNAMDAYEQALSGWPGIGEADIPREYAAAADLLREIFGNPFHPVSIDPAWRTSIVLTLAQAAYDALPLPGGELDPHRLADALEEAGCTEGVVLGHLRSAAPHVRGCWALDLALAKS